MQLCLLAHILKACQRPLTYPGDNIHKIMTKNILGFIGAGFNVLIYKVHDDDDDDDVLLLLMNELEQ
jgi:hypothetical protein